MPKVSKTIQDPNLIVFINDIVAAVKDGWELDDQNPPGLYGFYYEVQLLKDENLIEPPKPSRAEILANARATKAAKKVEVVVEEAPVIEPSIDPVVEAPVEAPQETPAEEVPVEQP